MEQFRQLGPVQAASQFWSSLTSAQKLITSIFVVSSIILLAVVAMIATKPKMEVLFSGLQPDDAGAIVAKLQERKIEYEIDGGGSVIKVPSKSVAELRLQMATDGLPQGGTVGFELFDKTNLGMTEFAQKVQYQRALQGELMRTIDQIDSVVKSKVSLAIPERSLFEGEDKHPTASVCVKLRAGSEMGSEQVAGIVHLVSSAVEGMKPEYVDVVDTRGNVLSESSDSDSPFNARLTNSQIELKTTYEKQMQKNIESMLERVLGPNKAIVRVNTKMNFDQKQTDSETYEPVKALDGTAVAGYKGVLLSEDMTHETYGSKQGQTGGVVGTASALAPVRGTPPPATVSVEGSNGGYIRDQSSTKYQVSKTTQHIVQAPGTVEQVSVAVMVNSSDPGIVPSIQRSVEAAAGIDPKRDKVTVETMKFDESASQTAEKEMASAANMANYMNIGKTVGGILLLLGFLFFLKKMLTGIKIGMPGPSEQTAWQQDPAPAMVYSPATVGVGAVMPEPEMAMAGAPSMSSMPTEVAQSPDEVAQVVREWISN
jgi:flagellar M-ring protein FliF